MLFLIVPLLLFGCANGYNAKSSLTFVIDDTGSMYDDIDQVKEKTNTIFDAVLTSNSSKIDEFIIVTFNDPDAKLYTVTKDRDVFKKALADIRVGGGDDCPEYAMKGIELALENSKPNSLFYVYTDAAAKDYKEFERIKSLGLKKSIQVTFLLTGRCDELPEGLNVYDKLAEATSGQVFHLKKHDLRKIIDYIVATIKSKKTSLAQKYFSEGSRKSFQFSVDSKLWDIMISMSGYDPNLHVYGADGERVKPTETIRTDRSTISTFNVGPGVYSVNFDSPNQASIIITGSTTVSFQHGFSIIKPKTLNETSFKPIAGIPSYLSIELDNVNRDVELDSVEMRDINDNFISRHKLKLVDKDKQFYVTEKIRTPNYPFKVVINGFTITGEKITRITPTTIEQQQPELEGPKYRAPTVTILEGSNIHPEYDSNLSLKCKVNAFPKPDIVWKDSSETIWESEVVPVDLPYEYMSVLDIEKINKNVTLYCTAENLLDRDSKSIYVETKRNYFLNVLESPKDQTIEYGSSSELHFKVDAYPLAAIRWYRNGKKIETNKDYTFSADSSGVVIKKMHSGLKGNYTIEAFNEGERKFVSFKIDMSGETPAIDKSISFYNIEKGSNVTITCRIIRGKPQPSISWIFESKSLKHLDVKDDLHLDNVGPENIGFYTCTAENEFGSDSHEIDLFVEYRPTIETFQTDIKVREGEPVLLTCKVDGSPYPFVRWLFNGDEISNTGKYSYNDNSLSFTGSIYDSGTYTCEASNTVGQTQEDFHVNVYIPVKIEAPKVFQLNINVGNPLLLSCRADGYPKPDVKWIFYSENNDIDPKIIRSDQVSIEHIQVEDEGIYRCTASNIGGLKSVTYKVQVRAPVSITNPNVAYEAVKGDLVLRMPCNAIGSPKPKVTWSIDGLNIASGTDWFDIAEDGTLVIKYPALDSGGTYICNASNGFTSDTKEFIVNVTPSPKPSHVNQKIMLELGTSGHIECDLPHKAGDVLNWFKYGELIKTGELYLKNIKMKDTGIYSCRVSTFLSAHTLHKNISIGYKPSFSSEEETNIDYSEGEIAYMACPSKGYPEPEAQWKHNGSPTTIKDMYLIIEMKPNDIGKYECIISNEFGSISRTFNIDSGECLLDIKKDFFENQPLLLSTSREWPDFKTSNLHVRVPKLKYFLLSCPGSSISYEGQNFGEEAKTMCIENSKFELNNKTVNFYEIECEENVKSLAKSVARGCFPGNTELLEVGFNLRHKFLSVYDVCIDKDKKVPLYTRHDLSSGFAGTVNVGDVPFTESKFLPFSFEDMYKCSTQLKFIPYLTENDISQADNECCFIKRQLVGPRDVLPGTPQVATYNYLNVVPHWSSCDTSNWDEIGIRLRSLAKLSNNKLSVYTGASHPLTLEGVNVSLSDSSDRRQRIPMYIWKVVQNPKEQSSLAIIQLNIPGVTFLQALRYMPCRDICSEVEWMKNYNWFDVKKGFTFCCSINDFASHFGTLFKGHEEVFKTLPSLVADHYY